MKAARPTLVRAFEYSRVQLPEAWNTATVRERLDQAALRAGFRAFEIRGRQLHALGVVGVVDLGDLIVEILPRTHEDDTPGEATIFLSELLQFGGVMDRLSVVDARTSPGERMLLEIVLAWVVREALSNVREGLPRRYETRNETSTAVRGRIEMRQLARRGPGREFELHVRHAPLSEDNALSRIVRWLLVQVSSRTRLVATRRMAQRVLQDLAHVGDAAPDRRDVQRIVLQQTELHWRPLLDFADMLLRQVSPDPTRAGRHDAVAVLFRLHDLFERVLRRVFRDGLPARGLQVHRQSLRLLSGAAGDGHAALPLKPDLLFGPQGSVTAVGDAKWKRILDGPSGAASLSEADAYQLTTYLAAYRASEGFVFCPTASATADQAPVFQDFTVTGLNARLSITGVNLPALIARGARGAAARAALCGHVTGRLIAASAAA